MSIQIGDQIVVTEDPFWSTPSGSVFGFDYVDLFIDPAGDDANDGRSIGSPCLTLQGIFDKIPNVLDGMIVVINAAAGSYLNMTADLGTKLVYDGIIILGDITTGATTANVVSSVLVPGKASTRETVLDVSVGPFANDGDAFVYSDFGFSPLFFGDIGGLRAGPAGTTIRHSQANAASGAITLCPYNTEFSLNTIGFTRGIVSTFTKITMVGIKISSAGVDSVSLAGIWFAMCNIDTPSAAITAINGVMNGWCVLQASVLTALQVNLSPGIITGSSFARTIAKGGECRVQSAVVYATFDGIFDGFALRVGSFPNSNDSPPQVVVAGLDCENKASPIQVYGGAVVRQLGSVTFESCSGTGILVDERSTWKRQLGDAVGSISGVGMQVKNGGQALGISGYSLTGTTGDLKVGANPGYFGFASLPKTDIGMGDLSELCRAT